MSQLFSGVFDLEIQKNIQQEFDLSEQDSAAVFNAVLELIQQLNHKKPALDYNTQKINSPGEWEFETNYNIENHRFNVRFQTKALAHLVHPKFAHLETKNHSDYQHHFEVFWHNQFIILKSNDEIIGHWSNEDLQYFQGKFSMCLIEKLYQKSESDWLGVFHASALSDGTNSLLFMGDSGHGKSTLAALLVAKGWHLLADDFAPIASENSQLYYFPAAISIKEGAIQTLLPYFPNLNQAMQHDFKYTNKKVRYLVPQQNQLKHEPCKALIFVKYDKKVRLKCETIDKALAFERLIPDSWLSPLQENAQIFLNWFDTMPCYELTYSDTDLMYKTVATLFKML